MTRLKKILTILGIIAASSGTTALVMPEKLVGSLDAPILQRPDVKLQVNIENEPTEVGIVNESIYYIPEVGIPLTNAQIDQAKEQRLEDIVERIRQNSLATPTVTPTNLPTMTPFPTPTQ